ncbi:MAG: RNA methyltransferase [Deltaproteobacteria bacterium]|nr:RNA methyltransferase [Deltaproteobacteria bacterium]
MSARLVPIVDLGAPEVAPYASVRDRDLARAEKRADGAFVAEGEVVVRVLASPRQRRFRVRSLLVERRRVDAIGDVIEALPSDVTVYVAPQEVMDGIVGFHIHRGILALGERGAELAPREVLEAEHGAGRGRSLAVGLVSLTNHDNVGSIFRNAAAFGARGVLLDGATCDPLYRKAIRVSVGGALVVPFARCATAHAMIEEASALGWEVLGLTARGDAAIGEVVREPPKVGRLLLLGTEGDGLPADVLAKVRRVRIEMTETLDSLNVAVASGIALYECTRPL